MKKVDKKTTKVKTKRVKSKKTTTKKKKTKKKARVVKSKKKIVKSVRKYSRRKTRKRKKKVVMEDIYTILNKVQIGKKRVTFATYIVDAPTIENNIRDVGLSYKKAEMKTQIVFTIFPNEIEYGDDQVLPLEIMDDEIPDMGQIFG